MPLRPPKQLIFPVAGLNENSGFPEQPPLTTNKILNCRSHDAIKGRLRGGSRPGMSQFFAQQISGPNPIQTMHKVTKPKVSFTPTGAYLMLHHDSGDNDTSFVHVDRSGTTQFEELWDQLLTGIDFDETDYYLAGAQEIITGVDGNAPNVVWKLQTSGATLPDRIVWFWGTGPVASFHSAHDVIHDAATGLVYVAMDRNDDFDGNSGNNASLVALNAATGALVWETDLGTNTIHLAFNPTTGVLLALTVFATSLWTGGSTDADVFSIDRSDGSIGDHWDSGSGTTASLATDNIDVRADGTIIVCNRFSNTAWEGNSGESRNIWILNSSLVVQKHYDLRATTDASDHRLVSFIGTDDSFAMMFSDDSTPANSVVDRYDSTGSLVWDTEIDTHIIAMTVNSSDETVVIMPRNDAWEGSGSVFANWLILQASDGVVVVNADNTDALNDNAIHVRYLDTTVVEDLSTRESSLIIVSAGTIKRLKPDNTLITPSGGDAALVNEQYVVNLTQILNNVLLVDGTNSKAYDLDTDIVSAWVATAGTLPALNKLIARYRGRVVLAGSIADPGNWFMSKTTDAFDWDFSPATPSATQAVAGNNSEAGLVGDVITSLMPFSKDALLFGCDSTLWQMSGDPASGGSIDLVSDKIGAAWNAWTQDPEGNIYFFAVDGVYRMTEDQRPIKISQNRIDRRFQGIDLANNRVLMEWDFLRQTLNIVIVGLGSSAQSTVFIWDQRADAWTEEDYPAAIGPSFMYAYNAEDPDDVEFLLGSKDGFIRRFDDTDSDDDGTAITSTVRYAPEALTDGHSEGVITGFDVTLAEGSGNVTLKVYTGQSAELATTATAPRISRTLKAGPNQVGGHRVRGKFVQIELTSTNQWAMESMFVNVETSGMKGRLRP